MWIGLQTHQGGCGSAFDGRRGWGGLVSAIAACSPLVDKFGILDRGDFIRLSSLTRRSFPNGRKVGNLIGMHKTRSADQKQQHELLLLEGKMAVPVFWYPLANSTELGGRDCRGNCSCHHLLAEPSLAVSPRWKNESPQPGLPSCSW